MLEVSVLHNHLNIMTNVVVVMPAVGIDAPGTHLLRNAFNLFKIVNGFIQNILVTFRHFKVEVSFM